VEVRRSVVIARPAEEVFAYLLDARHDPQWCPKVLTVEQVQGAGPGVGARYRTTHRPIPLRPPREMDHRCLSATPPRRIEWREDDGTDEFLVTYDLEDRGSATCLTQRSVARLGAWRPLHPLLRAGIGHDIAHQLRALKTVLESRADGASKGWGLRRTAERDR
jgi:uncharacterized protein YndB with AHSA1/START domain